MDKYGLCGRGRMHLGDPVAGGWRARCSPAWWHSTASATSAEADRLWPRVTCQRCRAQRRSPHGMLPETGDMPVWLRSPGYDELRWAISAASTAGEVDRWAREVESRYAAGALGPEERQRLRLLARQCRAVLGTAVR